MIDASPRIRFHLHHWRGVAPALLGCLTGICLSLASVRPSAAAEVKRIEPVRPKQGQRIALEDEILFGWEPVATATRFDFWYARKGEENDEKKRVKVDVDPEAFETSGGANEPNVLAKGLKRGPYVWQVAAYHDDEKIAETGKIYFEVGSYGVFDRLADKGLTLQRTFTFVPEDLINKKSLLDEDEAKEPATVSFYSTAGEGHRFNSEFALLYRAVRRNEKDELVPTSRWILSAEGLVNQPEDGDASNFLRFRATHSASWGWGVLLSSVRFEGDERFDTQKVIGQFAFAPVIRSSNPNNVLRTGIFTPPNRTYGGRVLPETRQPAIQVRWQPYVGVEVGKTLRAGDSAAQEDLDLRWMARGVFEAKLNFLGDALGLRKNGGVLFFADNTFRHLPNESVQNHNFLVLGLDFFLSRNVSLGARYRKGEEAPDFKPTETLGAELGVQF